MKTPLKKNPAPTPLAPGAAPQPHPGPGHTLSFKETMALCGISRMTLWRWRAQEGLPCIRGRISPAQLARWLIHREGLGP